MLRFASPVPTVHLPSWLLTPPVCMPCHPYFWSLQASLICSTFLSLPPTLPSASITLLLLPLPSRPSATALLNIKAAMGLTYTTWTTSNQCTLNGAAAAAGDWDRVSCTADGKISTITLDNLKLKASLPSDVSTLTALTYLNLPQNLFNARLDSFTTNLRSLPELALLALHYNYLYGEIPSFLVGLPKLTSFGAIYNYLIGTVPAVASLLKSLDFRGNFITDVPTGSYTWCAGDTNCLVTPSKCASNGATQRPASACAICFTTNGVGPFCSVTGGVCSVDATAAVTAGTVNSPSQALLPLACVGGTAVTIKESTAMLALKASLGVTLTTWAASVPCKIEGQTTTATVWGGVLCDSTGRVVSITQTYSSLKGSLASEISTLTALSFLNLQNNLHNYRLDSFSTYLQNLPSLYIFAVHYNYLYGEIPSFLMALPKLGKFGATYNYFIGTVPAIASKLDTLDVRFNLLTDVPTGSYSWCGGAGNCLVSPAKCTSGSGSVQRSAADCAFCGTTGGVAPFCWGAGGVCTADGSAVVAAGTVNSPTQPLLPMKCVGSPVVGIKESTAMLALKASLGVTLTTWAASVPCQIAGQTTTVAVWGGVLCDSTGSVVSISVDNAKVKGSLPTDISTLTSLTFLIVFLTAQMTHDAFPGRGSSPYAPVPWLLSPLASGAVYNYLIGTVPAVASKLSSLDVRGNFITDVPTGSYTWCGGDANCLTTPSKCSSGGTTQRAASACAVCGTTNGVGPFCASTGGVCSLDAAAAVTAGTLGCLRGSLLALLLLTCSLRPPLPPAARLVSDFPVCPSPAMLALKSSLGVTLTTWAASVPCQLAGQNTTAAVWTDVLCDSTGSVVSISAQNAKLKGSLPTDISTLTSLTLLNLAQNLFNYRIDSFTTNLQSLPVLANIALHYNYLYGEIPSFLVALPKLTGFGAIYNYLIGTVPALASGLRSLNVRGNFLTDVPAATYTYCGGDTNCLLTPSKCTTTGTTQRPVSNCAVCGTTNGTGPFCATGGVCVVDATAAVTAGTVNSPSQPVLPLSCSAPPVLVKESAAMLALKLELGVSFTTWAASVPCQLAGQAATVKVWTGVLCDSTGRVVSITLDNTKLYGSLSTDISTLTALTYLCSGDVLLPSLLAPRRNLPGNFFRSRLDSFTTSLQFPPSVPHATTHLTTTTSHLSSALTVFAPPTAVCTTITYVPTANYTFCGCAGNCMLTPAKCISNGTAQRPAAQCAFCGTTNGVRPFCWGAGGQCVADVTALWDVGIVNSPSQPVQPIMCMGGSVQAMADTAAMLAIKSSLGVTFNSWAASVPCSVWVESTSIPTWSKVICDDSGSVVSINLDNTGLTGSIPADISKLDYLTNLTLSRQLFQAPLAAFTANLLGATFLNELYLQSNWLYGSVPTALVNLQLLSKLDLSYNYLTGSFPVSSSLASLDVRSNFLYAVATMTLVSCAAVSNCLATPAACSTAGTTQRAAADCAICGSSNGQPPFCGGTGACAPDSGPAAASGMPNVAGSPLLPMECSGVTIDAADAAVLLALKSSLAVTLNNWIAAALCTLEGQTMLPAQWGGVRCTAAGKVTSIAAACGASSTTQRAAAACAICSSADAQGLLCWGGMCLPNVTPTTAHPDGLAPPPMYCAGSPVVNISSADGECLASHRHAACTSSFSTHAMPCLHFTPMPFPVCISLSFSSIVLCPSMQHLPSPTPCATLTSSLPRFSPSPPISPLPLLPSLLSPALFLPTQ
ncbi:unnamed protein product [Closterium sp. Yama58-4]|nr:unnamed protein product [Closterium sp. Yama58-4]